MSDNDKNKGLNEFQLLQSKEIARQVIADLKESIVCTEHCQQRHYKINTKILLLFILSGLSLSVGAGIKFIPILLRMVV